MGFLIPYVKVYYHTKYFHQTLVRHSTLLQFKDMLLFFIGYKNTVPERTFKSAEKLKIGLNIQRP